jgi:hypothetical protein
VPPLTGQLIMNLTGGNGAPSVTVTWFFNPNGPAGARPLRNNTTSWKDPWGTTWLAGSGAFISVNQSSKSMRLRVSNTLGVLQRSLTLPAGSNARTAASLTLGGLFLTAEDFNGATFEVL